MIVEEPLHTSDLQPYRYLPGERVPQIAILLSPNRCLLMPEPSGEKSRVLQTRERYRGCIAARGDSQGEDTHDKPACHPSLLSHVPA